MNRFAWLNWFDRSKITLLIGSLALSLGALAPWYHLPPQVAETFGVGLAWINVGRIVTGLLALCGFIFSLWLGAYRAPRLPFWGGLFIALLFPYWLTTWSPSIAFIARSYYDQSTQVTTHIEDTFPHVQAQWQQGVSLNVSSITSSALPLRIADSRFFQLSSWNQIVEGLGYNNAFWQLIDLGWLITLMGLVIALLGIYLGAVEDGSRNFFKDIHRIFPGTFLGSTILIFSILLPQFINHQLDTNLAKGEYRQLLSGSQILSAVYPPFTEDFNFLRRTGEGRFYNHEADSALTHFVQGTERYDIGDLLGAVEHFQQALAIEPNHALIRGYLATTLLNLGVRDFNNALPAAAANRFEQVLEVFPNHLEALYDLMLATAVNNEFDRSAQVAQQIIKIEEYFQIPSVALLGRAYLHISWDSYHNGDINQAWQQYRKSVDKRAWKE